MKRYFLAEITLFGLVMLTIYSFAVTFSGCQAEIEKNRVENPVQSAQDRCYSKISGSRPACWSEGDWIAFCERVQCKEAKQ